MPEFHTAAAEYRHRRAHGLTIPLSLASRLVDEGSTAVALTYRTPTTDQETSQTHG